MKLFRRMLTIPLLREESKKTKFTMRAEIKAKKQELNSSSCRNETLKEDNSRENVTIKQDTKLPLNNSNKYTSSFSTDTPTYLLSTSISLQNNKSTLAENSFKKTNTQNSQQQVLTTQSFATRKATNSDTRESPSNFYHRSFNGLQQSALSTFTGSFSAPSNNVSLDRLREVQAVKSVSSGCAHNKADFGLCTTREPGEHTSIEKLPHKGKSRAMDVLTENNITNERKIPLEAHGSKENTLREIFSTFNTSKKYQKGIEIRKNRESKEALKLETQNVQGFTRKNEWFNEFKRKNGPHVMALQETHIKTDTDIQTTTALFGRVMGITSTYALEWAFWSRHQDKTGGVGIIINPFKGISDPKPIWEEKWHQRFISIQFKYANKSFILINVYVSTAKKEREKFWQDLHLTIPDNTILLLMGDFNCVNDLQEIVKNSQFSNSLEQILNHHQLLDTIGNKKLKGKIQPSAESMATWGTGTHTKPWRRLDRIYINKKYIKNVVAYKTSSSITRSDHKRVSIKLILPGFISSKRTSPLYPLPGNTAINTTMISAFIKEQVTESDLLNRPENWSDVKTNIISFLRQLKRKISNFYFYRYKNSTRKLKIRLKSAKPPQKNDLQSELMSLRRNRTKEKKAMQIGYRIQQGDNLSRNFFKRVNSKYSKTRIEALFDNNQNLVTKSKDLPDCMASKWQNIMNPVQKRFNRKHLKNFLPVNHPVLPENSKKICISPVTDEEVTDIFQSLKKQKSPGPDSLPNDFYIDFREYLTPIFKKLLQFWVSTSRIPEDFTECNIITLAKAGDRNRAMNYRPISLLNTDYKILGKLLANRIRYSLKYIIHDDQSGFVPGRRIDEAILKTIIVNKYLKSEQGQPGRKSIQVAVDFHKAYDSLNRKFLWYILKWFGFPRSLISLIKKTYTATKATFIVNGFSSKKYLVSSGIRQGCPLAPLLFIIAMEIILMKIRQSTSITGITFHAENRKVEIRTVGFVDDLMVTLKKANQLPKLLQILRQFSVFSSLVANPEKIKGIWLDKSEGPKLFHGITFLQRSETMRYLGILIGPGGSSDANWKWFIQKSKQRLFLASIKSNTLKGRCTIVNSIFMAGIRFMAEIYLPSLSMKTKLYQFIRNYLAKFLLNENKVVTRLPVAYPILTKPLKQGGLGLLDLDLELKKNALKKVIRWLLNPNTTIYYIKRYLMAQEALQHGLIHLPKINNTLHIGVFYGRFNIQENKNQNWVLGLKELQQLLNKQQTLYFKTLQEWKSKENLFNQPPFSITAIANKTTVNFKPWLYTQFTEYHSLLYNKVHRSYTHEMLLKMPFFQNTLFTYKGKTLEAIDYVDILAPSTQIEDLIHICEQSEFSISFRTKQYAYYQGAIFTSTQKNKWKQIYECLLLHFPVFKFIRQQQSKLTVFKAESNNHYKVFEYQYFTKSFYIGTNSSTASWFYWETKSLKLKNPITNADSGMTLEPHTDLSRIILRALFHKGKLKQSYPHQTSQSKENQYEISKNIWLNEDKVNQLLPIMSHKVLQDIKKKWEKESPEIATALYHSKWNTIWHNSITSTSSMQWFLYRLRIHRLPIWHEGHSGYCTKESCCRLQLKETHSHILWDCAMELWKMFISHWMGKSSNNINEFKFSIFSGLLFLPLYNKPNDITAECWMEECKTLWALLTKETLRFIWHQRNFRIFEKISKPPNVIATLLQKHLSDRMYFFSMTSYKKIALWKNMQTIFFASPDLTIYSPTVLIAFFDGGSRGNPGQGGSGAWILDITCYPFQLFTSTSYSQEINATNNQAEYNGLTLIINMLYTLFTNVSFIRLIIVGDSQLIINQLNGRQQPKLPEYKDLISQIKILLPSFSNVSFRHHTRAGNKLADYLSNLAMDKDTNAPNSKIIQQFLRGDIKALLTSNLLDPYTRQRITTETTTIADIPEEYTPLFYRDRLKISLIKNFSNNITWKFSGLKTGCSADKSLGTVWDTRGIG